MLRASLTDPERDSTLIDWLTDTSFTRAMRKWVPFFMNLKPGEVRGRGAGCAAAAAHRLRALRSSA